MTILEPYRQFSDSRGQMLGVINDGKWEEINYVETVAGCVRGGHYHRNPRELFLMISGTIKVRIRPVNGQTSRVLWLSALLPGRIPPHWAGT